jgi:hypothetical protein
MLEPIGKIFQTGAQFDWENHLVALVKRLTAKNAKKTMCAIKFPSLLIWIAMSKVCPVREPSFTAHETPTMNNFRVFSSGASSSYDSISPNIMFKCWVNHVKNVSHKWCFNQKVSSRITTNRPYSTNPGYHHALVWNFGGPTPKEMEYQPYKVSNFPGARPTTRVSESDTTRSTK